MYPVACPNFGVGVECGKYFRRLWRLDVERFSDFRAIGIVYRLGDLLFLSLCPLGF